jgi:hypothetical protein
MLEVRTGIACVDAFCLRGRLRAEEHHPTLLADLKAIVDGQSQTDPRFRTDRLYTRLSAAEVRRQLIRQKGYTDEEAPAVRTISGKLNQLGYRPTKVAKCRPKKSPADGRHLRPAERSQPGGGPGRECPAAVDGCQGNREDRPVFSGR